MTFWKTIRRAADIWLERNAFMHAAALAFYTLFSMAPVVIIAVSIAGTVFGRDAARGEIVSRLDDFVGADAARVVQEAVARSRPDVVGLLPTITGMTVLLIGATTVFAQMQYSLNRFWGVRVKPRWHSTLAFVQSRMLSLAIVLIIGFILLGSLLANVTVRAVVAYVPSWVRIPVIVLDGTELVLSLIVITLLFAIIFKVLPDVAVAWRDVWVSAAVTAVLFVAGRYVIAFYLAYTALASTYGAAGSLVLILLWVYYSSLTLFFGVALTRARMQLAGKPIVPLAVAVRVREQIIEESAG